MVRVHEMGLFLALVVVIVFIAGMDHQGNFVSAYNRERLLHQFALLGVFAVGEAVVIIAGGIDLSVGSMIGFSSVVCALLLSEWGDRLPVGAPYPFGLIAGAVGVTLLVGLLVGLFHAVLVTKLSLPPFVATLGTLAALRSGARILSHSNPIPISDDRFRALGSTWWVTLIVFLVVLGAVGAMLRRTTMGRQLYALGGNEPATRLSGVNVAAVKTLAYCMSAVLAALAGILYTAYLGQGSSESGIGYELNAVAAAVVGGCSLQGGLGTAFGAGLGVALLVIVINGTALLIKRDATLWEGIIVGAVVILAVAVNRFRIGSAKGG